jgi:isoleucyl-tRNA synthetase
MSAHFEAGALPERADFAKMEEKVLNLWKAVDAFKTSLKLSEGKPEVSPFLRG